MDSIISILSEKNSLHKKLEEKIDYKKNKQKFLSEVLKDLKVLKTKFNGVLESQKKSNLKRYSEKLSRVSSDREKNLIPKSQLIFFQKDYSWILMTCIMKGIDRCIDEDKIEELTELDFEKTNTFELETM